jgi:hypothetical protein
MSWEHVKAWLDPKGIKRGRPYPLWTESVDVSAAIATANADYSANPLRGLYVGGAGVVYLKLQEDSAFSEWDCPAGFVIPGLIVAVRKLSTTATKLRGGR